MKARRTAWATSWARTPCCSTARHGPASACPRFGYTFFWAKRSGVLRWRELSLESDFIRVKKFYAQQVVAANAAYLWLNATT